MLANKKIVKVYLDILKMNKKTGREGGPLDYVVIKDGWLYVTNGYALVANETTTSKDLQISREKLEQWYKLADGKSTLEFSDFEPLSVNIPDYHALRSRLEHDVSEPVKENEFDSELLKVLLPAFKSLKVTQGSNYVMQLEEGAISLMPQCIYLLGKRK